MNELDGHESREYDLSIVIPAYNEEERLGHTLDLAADYFREKDYSVEVIVVDDGSQDKTSEVAENRRDAFDRLEVLKNEGNKGKGYSVRRGMTTAKGKYRIFYDADASTPIEEVDKIWEPLRNGYDIVIGSRSLPESNVEIHQSWLRERLGKIFSLLVSILAMRDFIDTQCGFKCFTRRAVELTFPRQTLTRWAFDVELLYVGKKHGLRIIDIPVRWLDSPRSKLNPYTDSIVMFLELITIRVKSLLGRYR